MSHDADEKLVISGEKARQGEIILRKPWQRFLFLAGLAGIILLAIILWRVVY